MENHFFALSLPQEGGLEVYLDLNLFSNVVSYGVLVATSACSYARDLLSRGSAHKVNWKGVGQLLCVALSMTVIACLLCRSGDVETNPGPDCEPLP